jgi:hypothetical protein
MHAINGWRMARRMALALGALSLCALACAQPREGVQVGQPSVFANMIAPARLERDAALQYQQRYRLFRAGPLLAVTAP